MAENGGYNPLAGAAANGLGKLKEAAKQTIFSAAKIGAHSIDRKKKRDAAVAKVARKTLQIGASGEDIKSPTGV